MVNLLQAQGGQPQKQPKYVPIFMDRAFTGLYTQRAVLHDPSDVYTARFYGGRPDALLGGRNIELTNRLTLQRRPGSVPFVNVGGATEGALYPTVPNRAFSFQLSDGTIRVIVDTGSSGSLAISSCANASGGSTVYTGVFPGGASNGYAGLTFVVAGFVTNPTQNNGTFVCTASTTTTLTLSNPNGIAETIAATAVTSGGVYWDKQDGTNTLLFGKSVGAGQTYFIAVAGVLYMGDGVDTKKYTPLNTNGTLWNWGIVAPKTQPTVTTTPSGSAATKWQKSTVFSTMGATKDSNTTSQVWVVVGVNADGSNPGGQFGKTGSGEPNWGSAPAEGNTLVDGTVTWLNMGDISKDWSANTYFADLGIGGGYGSENFSKPAAFSYYAGKTIYGNYKNSGSLGNTGSTEPSTFSSAYPGPSGGIFDNNTHWFAIGSFLSTASMARMRWAPSTTYPLWVSTGSNNAISGTGQIGFILSTNLPAPTGTPVYLFIAKVGGTSSSGYNPFPASAAFGQTISDGQVSWMCLGQAAWQSSHTYVPWTAFGVSFSMIFDGTNFQVATKVTGLSGGIAPTWSTGYGSTTIDGGVTWACVGPSVAWAAAQTWHCPLSGFIPPSTSEPFGGSEVVGTSDGYVQAVISSGTSGSGSEPTWPAVPPASQLTTDNTITWQQTNPATTNSLAWSFGLCYAYSYKAMPLTDFYAPTSVGGGGNVPPGGTAFGVPTGSETNAISSASPVNQLVGPNSGSVNTISGDYSPDPQVDTIVIWRSADTASGSGSMFELTEIPNIPSFAGVHKWQFADYLPSVANGAFPGLNILLPAPINGVNNPPPSNYLPQVFNYQRIWGSQGGSPGQSVGFSGGPDTEVGNPNEAFKASDNLPFLAPVIRLVKTPQGIVTFLTDSIEMIGGGPATATFFSVTMAPGVGLLSFNACDVFAGEIYFFAADNTFRVITPGLNLSQFGFPLGDQFANNPSFGSLDTTWNPANVYVAVHQSGTDNCIFVADGSTGWYRLNPHQVPGAAQGPEPIWSPFATITGGTKVVQSVEVSPGVKQLLVGPTTAGNDFWVRSLTTFSDDGTGYDAYFTMGSITLAHPGQLAILKFLEFDFSGVSLRPTVSYLLNEISGTFTPFVNGSQGVPQFDPPSLYGATLSPASYSPNRYYFSANAALARCRHMQVKVDFGSGTSGDELYSMTIFGRLMVET